MREEKALQLHICIAHFWDNWNGKDAPSISPWTSNFTDIWTAKKCFCCCYHQHQMSSYERSGVKYYILEENWGCQQKNENKFWSGYISCQT